MKTIPAPKPLSKETAKRLLILSLSRFQPKRKP